MEYRLNKFLAERLGLSRRQADDAITSGKVTVDGKIAALGARIDKNAKVCYNGEIVPYSLEYTYLALNKPVNYVCSRKRQGSTPTIYELLPKKYQDLKTVGRLDKDSSGIILLTNDGDFAFQHTHPKFIKEKQYEVELDRDLEPLHQQEIAEFGIDLADGKSRLGLAHLDGGRKKWLVTMSEGRNRQIRRTFAAVGYTVVKLHRIQFGKYKLSGLKPGEFVEFKP
jgi:23S rRNA pseudouridine2605 synthase